MNVPIYVRLRAIAREAHIPVIALIAIAAPVCLGVTKVQVGVLRDNFDLYSQIMVSLVQVVMPAVVVLIACTKIYREMDNRYVANIRTRQSVRVYLARHLARSATISFVVFALDCLVPFYVAFVVWPEVGNPLIDPTPYGLNESTAYQDSLTRSSYSNFLEYGNWTFALGYAAWVGIGASTLSAIGVIALILIPNRFVALITPLVVYLGQTLVASLLGVPEYGVMFSLFPFGLTQQAPFAAAAPVLLLIAVTIGIVLAVLRSAPRLERLA